MESTQKLVKSMYSFCDAFKKILHLVGFITVLQCERMERIFQIDILTTKTYIIP